MRAFHWPDRFMESLSRHLARRTSRRSLLARLGAVLVGGAALPLLPYSRRSQAANDIPDDALIGGPQGDPTACDYWRYCSIDGDLCSCCGGTQSSCPPGTELSKIAWVGTCRHPVSGAHYIISYHDCCGKAPCPRCFCNRNEGDTPAYLPARSNDITWCFGADNPTYHCTIAAVIGIADPPPAR
ncbi:MAG: methylamine dehydrogenase light chain [Burkholderiales bacterium]